MRLTCTALVFIFCLALHAETPGLVQIEVVRLENPVIGDGAPGETRVIWKTSEAVYFQVRRGYNCKGGEPLEKFIYSGATETQKENVLRIRSAHLKTGMNYLVICVNRRPINEVSSQDLDYGTDVFEKNLLIVVDRTAPVVSQERQALDGGGEKIVLQCFDDHGCESIACEMTGNGRSASCSAQRDSAEIRLTSNEDWVQGVRFHAIDRAGNRSPDQNIEISPAENAGFGRGRLQIFPTLLMRADARRELLPFGTGLGLAADFPLAGLLGTAQRFYIPALRLEAQLIAFLKDQATEENLSMVHAGFTWLLPLRQGKLGAFAIGVTGGPARLVSLIDARQVSLSLASSVGAFAGYEYAWRRLFFFLYARFTGAFSSEITALGPGAAAGVGLRF